MSGDLLMWALPRLSRLLPLDDASLREIITYTTTLNKEAGAEHLKNLLGDSNQALDFISTFNSRRKDEAPSKSRTARSFNNTPEHTDSDAGIPKHKVGKKARAPLHNAGPVRQPEGYGNVTGGYKKSYGESYMPGAKVHNSPATPLADSLALSQEPAALQAPKVLPNTRAPSPDASRDGPPAPAKGKMPPSAAGHLISDMPNVRSKQSKKPAHVTHSGSSTPRSTAQTTTTSCIADLTSAIAALEIATNPSLSSERRKCDCNASLHPLFETAPNCLSCGKIICALEGLQPCSYCDAPILTKEQVNSMIRALKDERGIERMATHNAGVVSGRGTPLFGASTPDSSSGDEASLAAARARAHRDKLLAFQRENAQRTRVYDEAADYDMTLTPGATQWMSPIQRAAALKKQQKYMRELQEANRPEWEKNRTVMSVSIKNGKLVRTYGRQSAPTLSADTASDPEEDVSKAEEETQRLSAGKGGAFSNNPLLTSGKLIRPIWKGNGVVADDEGSTTRNRKSVWRTVQDDNEDNEHWILDGGLRGYGTESRVMEDGSQQECG